MSSDAGSIPAASKISINNREKLFKHRRGIPKFILVFSLVFLFLNLSGTPQNQPILKLSAKDHENYSRVTIQSSLPLSSSIEKSESYIFVKIRANTPFRIQRGSFRSQFIKSVGWSQGSDSYILTIKTEHDNFSYDSFKVPNPPQLIIDIYPGGEQNQSRESDEKLEVKPIPERERERVDPPALDPECIVIDPGHGGLETGAKGKFGTLEKDITLAISAKLSEIVRQTRASNVVLTRERDVDISLEDRSAIANNNKATLFISIHVNGSYRKGAAGPETYFLSKDATDEEARRLAFLENKSEALENNIQADDEDVIKMILWDMAQTAYLKQSSQLAEDIQSELNLLWGTRNRGIKQAPFKVLTGVACPAVLVEVAFLSNPQEERKLLTEDYQRKVAEAIYNGLAKYLRNNSH
jgi:N-acetylmuramoyl-L-alanine amidase